MAFEDPMRDLEPALRALIADELRPGEIVRWCGRPEPLRAATRGMLMPLLVGVFWTAAIVWVFILREDGPPWWFALPFLAAGAFIIIRPFMARRRPARHRHRVYAVTDRRALAIGPGSVDEIRLDRESRFKVRRQRGGGGSVAFERPGDEAIDIERLSFRGVPDTQPLEQILQETVP